MNFPGLKSIKLAGRQFLVRMQASFRKPGNMVSVDSTVTDTGAVAAGLPRATILRPGFVLGKGTTNYFAGNDVTNVTGSTPASITGLVAIGAGAANKTLKFKLGGNAAPEITITTVTATTSCDALVTLLNANAQFAGQLVADKVATNKLRIRTLRVGRDAYFRITTGTLNGQGGSANDTFADNTEAGGTDGDYRVLGMGGGGAEDYLDMLDATATAAVKPAPNLLAGEFIEANLLNASPEAKSVLARQGSFFG